MTYGALHYGVGLSERQTVVTLQPLAGRAVIQPLSVATVVAPLGGRAVMAPVSPEVTLRVTGRAVIP